ncbi:uncharacterized protein LOC110454862 [Mizuhopecten yessoensis]|uniref:Uncharacterized protein n=1 Tax=Mizuhopecten yessoensis TaxID=6573 RepID=A0A210QEB1_MIZYE|nr:uncharacterized protein LOC110454862 [Mizuhopecten yessoensis]OWF47090.1 hypothetical protein KP79_PYT12577 [Mizuhopecten yessoensis]
MWTSGENKEPDTMYTIFATFAVMLLLSSTVTSDQEEDDSERSCWLEQYYEGKWNRILNDKVSDDHVIIDDNEMEVTIDGITQTFDCIDGDAQGYNSLMLSSNGSSYLCLAFKFRDDSSGIDYSVFTNNGTFEGLSPLPEVLTFEAACGNFTDGSVALDLQRDYTDTAVLQDFVG